MPHIASLISYHYGFLIAETGIVSSKTYFVGLEQQSDYFSIPIFW